MQVYTKEKTPFTYEDEAQVLFIQLTVALKYKAPKSVYCRHLTQWRLLLCNVNRGRRIGLGERV